MPLQLLLAVPLWFLAAEQQPKQQPLPYSHKTHVALGLKCAECHTNPAPGELMTFPAASKCMACHASIAKERPAIQQLTGYAKAKEPVPWVRVYAVASGTYWSHRKHAAQSCATCHGDVAQMDQIVKANARAGLDVTTMPGCIACHKEHKAPTGCDTCHEEK